MRCGWREPWHTAVSWICVHTTNGQVGYNRTGSSSKRLSGCASVVFTLLYSHGPKVQRGQLKLKLHRAKRRSLSCFSHHDCLCCQEALNTSGASVCQQLKGMIECLKGRHICTMVGRFFLSLLLIFFFCYRKCSMKMWFRWYERGLNKRRIFQRSGGPRPWHALTT